VQVDGRGEHHQVDARARGVEGVEVVVDGDAPLADVAEAAGPRGGRVNHADELHRVVGGAVEQGLQVVVAVPADADQGNVDRGTHGSVCPRPAARVRGRDTCQRCERRQRRRRRRSRPSPAPRSRRRAALPLSRGSAVAAGRRHLDRIRTAAGGPSSRR
jgi:hypothetical protein